MKAWVCIDGYLIGHFEYQLPHSVSGRAVAIPARPDAEYRSEVVVIVESPSGERWCTNQAKLEPSF